MSEQRTQLDLLVRDGEHALEVSCHEGVHRLAHERFVVIGLDVTATGAGSGVPIDQTYWLGARVRGAKIVFFGFFRTETDALEAVT
jgi:hypothetical protein